MIHYQNMVKGVDIARFQLGYALGEASNMGNPYEQVDRKYENNGEATEPVEEQETQEVATSDLSSGQCLMEIRKRGKTVFENLQDLHRKVRLPDTFLYLYLEEAALQVRELRSSAGVVYSKLFDEDSDQ